MVDLDDSIREDLARLRSAWGPGEQAKRRMWTALESRLGPGPPEDPGGEVPGDLGATGAVGSARVGFAAKVVAATLAMTGAGLLTLRLAVVALGGVAPDEPGEVADSPGDDARATTPPAVVVVDVPIAEPPSTPPPKHEAPSIERARVRPPAPVDGAKVDRSLSAELALLETASEASPAAALEFLDAHLQKFPAGQLADERDLMRIEALCGLDRLAAARTVAEDLRRRGSALASRAREVCPTIDE